MSIETGSDSRSVAVVTIVCQFRLRQSQSLSQKLYNMKISTKKSNMIRKPSLALIRFRAFILCDFSACLRGIKKFEPEMGFGNAK